MKCLAIFMFSIVIGLSVVPCCTPKANNNSNNLTKIDQHCCEEETCKDTEETTNENNEEEGCNNCSPFFSCGSCAGFTAQIDFIKLNHLSFPNSVAYSNFKLLNYSGFLETKWQPPKIS